MKKLQDNTPYSFTAEDGKHIWKHQEVMDHIRAEAHAIAEPEQDGYLSAPDEEMEEHVNNEVRLMQREANKKTDWWPVQDDIVTMMKYFRRAYTNRTSAGPDELSPDLILFADGTITDCLMEILNMTAGCGSTPPSWRKMNIVLAHKDGRDPQNIRKIYSPICVGSLMMKATESVLATIINAKT